MVKYGPRMSKMVLKGKKWSQNLQYGIKWSSMAPRAPKWSKQIDHTFNGMAFITRFNLVLVWSKIVKILTKKSSKWVRHNQVSWLGGGGNQGTRLYREAGYFCWSCSRKEYLTRKGGLLGRDSREQEQERNSWSCSE